MKKLEISVLFAVLFCGVLTLCGFSEKCVEVREDVFRLHVLANSDSREDQALKLSVRDRILEESKEIFSDSATKDEAIAAAQENLDRLTDCAKDEIAKQGYDYTVSIEIGESDFNTRIYDNYTLPAGTYQALRVKIGSAQGKNWWCVMFPQLCLPAAEDKAKPEEFLSEDEVELISGGVKYEYKFKIIEYFEKIKQCFK